MKQDVIIATTSGLLAIASMGLFVISQINAYGVAVRQASIATQETRIDPKVRPAKSPQQPAPTKVIETPPAPQQPSQPTPAPKPLPVATRKPAPQAAPAPVVVTPYAGVLEAVNEYRASKGLAAVRSDSRLQLSAQLKANDMVRYNYWAHTSPSGLSPWHFFTQAGYAYSNAGENLARCFRTAQGVVNGWINSPTHEAILTGRFVDAGFSYALNPADGCRYVVGHFGARS